MVGGHAVSIAADDRKRPEDGAEWRKLAHLVLLPMTQNLPISSKDSNFNAVLQQAL